MIACGPKGGVVKGERKWMWICGGGGYSVGPLLSQAKGVGVRACLIHSWLAVFWDSSIWALSFLFPSSYYIMRGGELGVALCIIIDWQLFSWTS